MYEYHGWAVMREKPHYVEDGNLERIVGDVKAYIETLNWNSGVLNINAVNGEYHILLNGSSNHAYLESDIFELLTFIAKIAEGTYGIFYLRNDEAEDGKDNEFRVIVMNRGMIRETSDHYLSPFIPIVEDAI